MTLASAKNAMRKALPVTVRGRLGLILDIERKGGEWIANVMTEDSRIVEIRLG